MKDSFDAIPKKFLVSIWPAFLNKSSRSGPGFYEVGPQVPFHLERLEKPIVGSAEQASEIFSFLDAHPPRSVLYMCFGSEYSPPTAHQAELLFAAIQRTGLDVVYVGPAGSRENTEMFGGSMESAETVYAQEMSKMGKRGLVAEWVPQYRVLEHKVGPL